jgi:UDP-glucose 4-epimerase
MTDSQLTGARVFITGGAGFIGSTLAAHLLDANRVTVFDSLARDALSSSRAAGHANLRLVRGDIRDGAAVAAAVAEADPTHIVHCAAIAGIDTVIKSPVTTLEVNLLGTVNILRAAHQLSALQRLIVFSTSEVFGQTAFGSTEMSAAVIGAVGEARWSYAVSKLAGEHLAHAWYKELGLPTTVVRPFNVYGPGQIGEGAIHIFIRRALAGQPLDIHGTGTQIRAWCYVDDMIRGLLLALVHPHAVGESFNIGNDRTVTTIYGLASTVLRVLGSPSEIRFVRRDYVDVELRVPNVEKARRLIGFDAAVDLDEGIARTADFYRAQQ